MKYVPTWHKHPQITYFNILAADRTTGRLQFLTLLLAMLFLNLDLRQLGDRLFVGLFRLLVSSMLLFTYSSDHLKNVIRRKVLLKVTHEIVRVKFLILHLHAHKLVVSTEHIHEIAH